VTNNCERCGANLDLVGRVHRCIERPQIEVPQAVAVTYRHRDPETRRAYMRDYMRKRRAT
jgi:hypothetical protein